MQARPLAGIAAIVIASVAMTAAAIDMARRGQPELAGAEPRAFNTQIADPLGPTLRRCQEVGGEAAHDQTCLAAWAKARRRFLGQDTDRVGLR